MTATMTLAEWLEQQVAADEALANAATPGPWLVDNSETTYVYFYDGPWGSGPMVAGQRAATRADAQYIATFNPARALAQIAAVREVLAIHSRWEDSDDCSSCGDVPQVAWPCETVQALARAYADREGYAEVAG